MTGDTSFLSNDYRVVFKDYEGFYEVTFNTKNREDAKAVEKFCKDIIKERTGEEEVISVADILDIIDMEYKLGSDPNFLDCLKDEIINRTKVKRTIDDIRDSEVIRREREIPHARKSHFYGEES